MHNRPVAIVFAQNVPISSAQRRRIAEFALDTWAHWWDVFGGFPWHSYTIVIRNEPKRSPAGELGIGYEDDASPLTRAGHWQENIGHNIFHAWWGNAVVHASSHEDRPNREKWVHEGFTQYYGNRAGGKSTYRNWMKGHWADYQHMIGTKYDVPLVEMSAYEERTGDREYRLKAYWKGALVAYMLDQRLIEQGMSLDNLVRYMYEHYGLAGRRYTTEDVRTSLEAVTGQDWGGFFEKYVFGTVPLPLGGTFEYRAP